MLGIIAEAVGGLSLFLFGMKLLGNGLERSAGGRLRGMLGKMTSGKLRALFLGAGVTALVQSSSATTVTVVGFVNSGVMTLRQAIGVIMGANIGTTLTAWLLSLSQTETEENFLRFLKPSVWLPFVALVGVVLFLFAKKEKRRNVGWCLLAFATLMTGMETMSAAVRPLAEIPAVGEALLYFRNPLFGVAAGALLTALLQSSSASVGVLQALSGAGQLSVGAAIPIVLGQNVGTCVTTLLSSVGASVNARRAAVVHLLFNGIGCGVLLGGFYLFDAVFGFPFVDFHATSFEIALIHTLFNLLSTALLFPFARRLEHLAVRLVREKSGGAEDEPDTMLDRRLLATPALAVAQSRAAVGRMMRLSTENVLTSFDLLHAYDENAAAELQKREEIVDRYEDAVGDYLMAVGSRGLSDHDGNRAAVLLHLIEDAERLSDHAVNVAEAAQKLNAGRKDADEANTEKSSAKTMNADAKNAGKAPGKGVHAANEIPPELFFRLTVLTDAVREILMLAVGSFSQKDAAKAARVEPLEQVIDARKEELRALGIAAVQSGTCDASVGVLLGEILTDVERIADHCSNVAGRVLAMAEERTGVHRILSARRAPENADFAQTYREFDEKYRFPAR